MDQLKGKMASGCTWSHELQQAYHEAEDPSAAILSHIVNTQSRKLVIDLLRELQQYMLSHASGTTD